MSKILTDGKNKPKHIIEYLSDGSANLKIRNENDTFETIRLYEQKSTIVSSQPIPPHRTTSMDLEIVFTRVMIHDYADVEYMLEIPEVGCAMLKIVVWSKNETHFYNLDQNNISTEQTGNPCLVLGEKKIPSFGLARLTKNDQEDMLLNIIAHLIKDQYYKPRKQ